MDGNKFLVGTKQSLAILPHSLVVLIFDSAGRIIHTFCSLSTDPLPSADNLPLCFTEKPTETPEIFQTLDTSECILCLSSYRKDSAPIKAKSSNVLWILSSPSHSLTLLPFLSPRVSTPVYWSYSWHHRGTPLTLLWPHIPSGHHSISQLPVTRKLSQGLSIVPIPLTLISFCLNVFLSMSLISSWVII